MISSNYPPRTATKQIASQKEGLVDTVDAVAVARIAKEGEKLLAGTPQSQLVLISASSDEFYASESPLKIDYSETTSQQAEPADTILANAVDLLSDADIDIAAPLAGPVSTTTDSAPNQTVQAADIEGLFYQSELDLSVVGLDLIESTILLLKSGMAFIGLRSSPLDLQVPQNTEDSEGSWAQWRKDGDEYQLKNSVGDWRAIDGVQVDTTPLQHSEVAGNYARVRSQNWGGTVFTDHQNVTLTDQGEFLTSATNLVTSGGIGSATPDSHTSVYSSEDHSGTTVVSTAVSAPETGTSTVMVSADQARDVIGDRFGSYSLLSDGLTIEFRFANGGVKRELFFRIGNSEGVFVGDRSFATQGATEPLEFGSLLARELINSTGEVGIGWQAAFADASKEVDRRTEQRIKPPIP